MDVLLELVSTKEGIALLLLMAPTIALGVFGFMWFRSLQKNRGNGYVRLVPRADYDAVLSSMRKEQRLMAAHIHKQGERLARVEAKLEERSKP